MNVRSNTTLDGGFNSTRRVLVQVIKLATNHDVTILSKRVFTLFDSWVKNEGKRTAVLRLKQIYHVVLNRSLGQTPPNYPFLATSRGFPRHVLYLEPLTSSPEGLQAVLTLLGIWRGVRAPGVPDLSTITSTSKSEPLDTIVSAAMKEIPRKWKFRTAELSQVNHFYKTTFGPNGKALYTSLSDLKALKKDEHLLSSIQEILDITDSEEYSEYLEELVENVNLEEIPDKVSHSRLSIKRELGGKDRIFAMLDYFTQCTLRPLHKKLAKILADIPSDATFDQDKAALDIMSWTEASQPETFSYDLSAATDRFPIAFQTKMLEELCGDSSLAAAWTDLMVNRTFDFRKLSGIKYSVGQPMGAYSSWPMFALSHHLIVLLSAKQAGIRHPKYKILGDDIVLSSEALAKCYLHNMKHLGVDISYSKSVTGKVAEFAKRLFYQGREITPIPVKLISATLRDYRLIGTLMQRIVNSCSPTCGDFNTVQANFRKLAKECYTPTQAAKADILLQLHSHGVARAVALQNLVGNLGGSYKETLERDFDILVLAIKYKYIVQQYNRSMELNQIVTSCHLKGSSPTVKYPGLDSGFQDLHPMNTAKQAQKSAAKRAYKSLGKFWTELTLKGPTAALPTVNIPDLKDLTPSHQKVLKQEATLKLLTYKAFAEYIEVVKVDPDMTIMGFIKGKSLAEVQRD